AVLYPRHEACGSPIWEALARYMDSGHRRLEMCGMFILSCSSIERAKAFVSCSVRVDRERVSSRPPCVGAADRGIADMPASLPDRSSLSRTMLPRERAIALTLSREHLPTANRR